MTSGALAVESKATQGRQKQRRFYTQFNRKLKLCEVCRVQTTVQGPGIRDPRKPKPDRSGSCSLPTTPTWGKKND